MPSVSKSQQRYFGMCMHRPAHTKGKCPNMSQEGYRKFAETSHKGLPERKKKKQGLGALRGK